MCCFVGVHKMAPKLTVSKVSKAKEKYSMWTYTVFIPNHYNNFFQIS